MQEKERETPSAPSGGTTSTEEMIDFALREHELDYWRGDNYPDTTFHTELWTFTRCIKSCFTERDNPHDVFFDLVEPEIERRGGWEILDTPLDEEEIYLEFVCNWDSVRYRLGETPLTNALAKAEEMPLQPNRASKHPGFLQRYSRFIGLAGWLQVTMGDRPILLPVERLAEILSVRPMTISRYREIAVKDGFLRVVREHAAVKGRATEFRFDVSRFNVLKDRAQQGTVDSFSDTGGR